jgi:hypothetical protein
LEGRRDDKETDNSRKSSVAGTGAFFLVQPTRIFRFIIFFRRGAAIMALLGP